METIETINKAEKELTNRFNHKLQVNSDLNRTLVSFQANKKQNGNRWFKYKEGFSANLVFYVLRSLGVDSGRLIDPFAGSGTALFVASSLGMDSVGIELLPVGCEVIRARQIANSDLKDLVAEAIDAWLESKPWGGKTLTSGPAFAHLRITNGAFPVENEAQLAAYLAACNNCPQKAARTILRFAAMCVLEEVSYTRKDGQYLRWDHRSGRRQGIKIFDKGTIQPFGEAVERKLRQIREDLSGAPLELFSRGNQAGNIRILCGSSLDCLPAIQSAAFDCLITSPPYCNRYDYTRTYALELAFLGVNEDRLKELRQTMISCTVENREKMNQEERFGKEAVHRARRIFGRQKLLNQVFEYLEARKAEGLLNNNGIPRMVKNYFWEMTLVIGECARILKPGAPLVMVNDNVRYEGAGIPVDLVLSDIAADLGFEIEKIWVLPVGKGNSSQQMGRHGRDELRKSVYIWRAPKGERIKRPSLQLVAEVAD